MGELRCVDGTLLSVTAIACRDRAGRPYEITLELARDRTPFGSVGQRCGHHLADLASRVKSARADPAQAAAWPDPDDRFPDPADGSDSPADRRAEPGNRFADLSFRPGEREYFTLRSRERSDLPGSGELRCVLRSSARWRTEPDGWELSQRAVLEAWSAGGTGVRAELTSAELVTFLDMVLRESDVAAAARSPQTVAAAVGEPPGGHSPRAWCQQGRVRDGSAKSRIPALRAAARVLTVAIGGTPARRGDVRR